MHSRDAQVFSGPPADPPIIGGSAVDLESPRVCTLGLLLNPQVRQTYSGAFDCKT